MNTFLKKKMYLTRPAASGNNQICSMVCSSIVGVADSTTAV